MGESASSSPSLRANPSLRYIKNNNPSLQNSREKFPYPQNHKGENKQQQQQQKKKKDSRQSFIHWILAPLLIVACVSIAVLLTDLFRARRPSEDTAPSPDSNEVTYGSVVKLMHERTKYRLHSHNIPYGSGSGQQSVTGFGGVEDSNSYWVVKEPKDSIFLQGESIPHGAIIRLQHMRTRKWLHSHLHPSPISGNLEVSCFGAPQESDSGDLWMLEIEGSGKVWMKGQKFRIQHVETGGYLHSHDKKYSRIAGGQQEVCGVRKKTADSIWIATEGVYLPVTQYKPR